MALSRKAARLLGKYAEQELMIPGQLDTPMKDGITTHSAKAKEMEKAREEFAGRPTRAESRRIVHGAGNLDARLFLVGEAPGADEERQGQPFVGPSGQLLTKMLAAVEIERADVYITNVVKWRLPDDREPAPDEIAECALLLVREVAIVKPALIVTLGAVAAGAILNLDEPISDLRGKVFSHADIPCLPMFHPAYLLRNPSAKKQAWEDLKLIKKLLHA